MTSSAIRHLIDLGFTDLEARIYLALHANGPATGYGIAQIINKPTANTYKGLVGLQRKGFVLADKGKKKRFAAAPIREVLGRIDREFQDRRKKTEDSLASLAKPGWDQNVYQLESVGQVYEQFRTMLRRAKQSVLADLGPVPFRQLRDDLSRAAQRRPRVTIKVYEDATLPGVRIIRNASFSDRGILQKGQWMSLVIDSDECCLAYISTDGETVHQALWSKSPFLSSVYHHGLTSEMAMDELAASIPPESISASARRILKRYVSREGYVQLSGIKKLMASLT